MPVYFISKVGKCKGWVPRLANIYQRFVRNADAPRRRGCFGVSRNQTKKPAHSASKWLFLLVIEWAGAHPLHFPAGEI